MDVSNRTSIAVGNSTIENCYVVFVSIFVTLNLCLVTRRRRSPPVLFIVDTAPGLRWHRSQRRGLPNKSVCACKPLICLCTCNLLFVHVSCFCVNCPCLFVRVHKQTIRAGMRSRMSTLPHMRTSTSRNRPLLKLLQGLKI